LESLGIKKLAYDYRAEHIASFDAEMEALKKHGIELTAWWFPGELNDEAKGILEVIRRHEVHPELWVTHGVGFPPEGDTAAQTALVESMAARLRPLAEAAAAVGCRLGLYNHGGWFGVPENQLALVERLERDGLRNVGLVYNLHHGHAEMTRFPAALEKMKSRLLALNLNGMSSGGEAEGGKIIPLGQGDLDLGLLKAIKASGWRGPVGILNHTDEDAEARLRDNLDGLHWLLKEMDAPGSGGPRPIPVSWKAPAPAPPKLSDFPYVHDPLHPELWPHWKEHVNRGRLYDFYGKQARWFRDHPTADVLLPEFPGLDGSENGHWGNQTEADWRDDRWTRTELGSVMGGVFRGHRLVIPKAVCVQLGGEGQWSACFDPEVMDFRVVWRGGFVGFTPTRHGLMDGVEMRGTVVPEALAEVPHQPVPPPAADKRDQPLVYHGFYRHGQRVIFSYLQGGQEMLDTAWEEHGKFVRQRLPAVEHPLRELLRGGPPQWPEAVETRGTLGQGAPYAVDTLTLPLDNPWKALLFTTGHDFYRNGDMAVCTMTGDVWRVSGVNGSLEKLVWRRIAAGLHQPLGLVMVDDEPVVLGRDQITALRDLNGDGEADFYECLTNAWTTSPSGHDFITGLERDSEGRFYTVASNIGIFRVKPGQLIEVLGTGFRNPDGIGLSRDGVLTTSVQEGEWTPASQVMEITPPAGYYGYPGPKAGEETRPPLLYLPRGVDNSSGGQTWVESDRWGPLKGQLIHFSHGAGTHMMVLREQVNGVSQGTAVPLAGDFLSGVHRGRFSPHDGQLYVTGMCGWGTYTSGDGCLERVRYTGGPVNLPVHCEARDNGVLLRFSDPLDPVVAGHAASHFAQMWNYLYASAYGSAEYSVNWPGRPGHDPVPVRSAHVLEDGKTLFLEMPKIRTAHQLHLLVKVNASVERDLFLTVHNLGAPFTDFPGWLPIAKTSAMPPETTAALAATAQATVPNPWIAGPPGREITIRTANGLQFATREWKARAGERLSLTLSNPDVVPHNWVLLKPGSADKVGALTNRLIGDPAGAARHYVPDVPEVLAWTDMTLPGGSFTIHFNAPADKGSYPCICTFPGHWMIMKG
ncbi:MAG: heme-binding domain-containing protein, partial [Verrucomicrobiaceae bacterium]